MNITLLAVGTKMPAWINQGYAEYAKRMQQDCKLHLVEVPAARRDKQATQSPAQIQRLLDKEQRAIEKALPKNAYVVALEVNGRSYTTEKLAGRLRQWMQLGQDIVCLIGGPEGLPTQLSQQAQEVWSLSDLTLPHPMVRVIVAESLYRAWSLNNKHPYHRAG